MDFAFQYIARAQSVRTLRCQQDVASPDSDLDAVAGGRMSERDFDFTRARTEPDPHHAVRFAKIEDRGAQQILESSGLREAFASGCIQNVHRRSTAHDVAVIHGDYSLAQSVDFFAAVGDIENRNAFFRVPGAQVLD